MEFEHEQAAITGHIVDRPDRIAQAVVVVLLYSNRELSPFL